MSEHICCACFTYNGLPCCNTGHPAERPCPTCGADPGKPCRTMLEGITMMRRHTKREVRP